MFTMLYYVTPDFRLSGAASLGAGAAISGVAWLGGCVVLAACVAALAPLDGVLAMAGLAIAFLAALWLTNVAVLAGVRLNAPGTPWAGTDGRAVHAGRLEPVSAAAWQEDLVRAVALALQNDDAHDGMLSPFAYAEEETARMSDLELDLADWAFTYGAAWATAKAQNPYAQDAEIAARALAAAREVFRLYCGRPDWEQRIRRQIRGRRPDGLVIEQVDEALGNGHGYGLLR
jgi:hypothetical protein